MCVAAIRLRSKQIREVRGGGEIIHRPVREDVREPGSAPVEMKVWHFWLKSVSLLGTLARCSSHRAVLRAFSGR